MMGVWDPRDKPTVLSQLKTLIEAHTGVLRTSRVYLYPGILLIFIVSFFFLSGCASFNIAKETSKVFNIIWPKEEVVEDKNDQDTIIVTDLESNVEIDETANTIACIKLQPECEVNEQ